MEYKLTIDKLRKLFCNTVEIFIEELHEQGISTKNGISTNKLARVLYNSNKLGNFEKCDGFYICYRNALFNEEFIDKEWYDKFMELANVKNCGKWIMDGYDLESCDWIINGKNLINCYHCKNCNSSRNLLYCSNINNLNDENYYVFNAPVSRTRWEQLRRMSHQEIMQQIEYNLIFDFNMINLNLKNN